MTDLTEIFKSATSEQIEKAKAIKTADELLSFARAEGIDITAEQADELLKMITPPHGELTDEELDNVAGGSSKSLHMLTCPHCLLVTTFDFYASIFYNGTKEFACTNCNEKYRVTFSQGQIAEVDPPVALKQFGQ